MFGKLHKKIGLLTHPHTTPPYLGPSRKKNIFWRLPKSPKVFFPNCARYEEKKIITTVRPGPGCTRMHTGKPLQAADLHWGRVRLPHQMNFWKNSKRPSMTRSLKFTHTAHMWGKPKQVWGDQKADGPENLLALRAEGSRVSSWPSNVGDKTIQ